MLAIERQAENLQAVFADTGHEHALTYEYLDYLQDKTGVFIARIKADFTRQINAKRKYIEEHWRSDGVPNETIAAALEILHPTGNPFLDLCLWKGRFPSAKARFCTEELKVVPIMEQIIFPILDNTQDTIESWQGVRRDESRSRAHLDEREGIEPNATRVFAYRPILDWTAHEVFGYHQKHGIKWNPLYEMGMGRVGCMPCINCRKGELLQIATRLPEEIDRVAAWEKIVSQASKRGSSTFFAAVTDPTVESDEAISVKTHGIHRIVEWSKTTRGGRQYDMLFDNGDTGECRSIYGLCEAAGAV